jgi:hypothetical protein
MNALSDWLARALALSSHYLRAALRDLDRDQVRCRFAPVG